MAELHVELVSVDRKLWSGDATMVIARTTEGEIGILPGHIDHLSVLVEGGVVDIRRESERTEAAVHGGFLLVHDDLVRILAESAELGSEIDVERARAALERARGAGDDDEATRQARSRAEARLRAAGQSV
ncbi:MAG: F0F1 ATP synthase subunit epsilon [Frankiaceae bacterium]